MKIKMMKSLLLTFLFILPIAINAQQNKDFEAEIYLKKSIKKRKAGNVLALTGGGLVLTGLVFSALGPDDNQYLPTNVVVGGSMITLGILSALTSIPFYISSNHNKKKYLEISPTATILPKNSGIQNENYALVGIEINF